MDRRKFLKVAAAGGAVVLSAPAGTAFGTTGPRRGRRVYVVVIDGLRPDEITPTLMPNLTALKSEGTWFPNARSLPVMETIPNHVMMMSGLRPDRTGVPANEFYDRERELVRTLDQPADWRGKSLLDRLPAELGLRTGSVLSKEYLYGIFGERATYRWEPSPIVPVSGHAPDQFTKQALLAMVDEADPDLLFCNLGECDRAGHSDLTGTTLAAVRTLGVTQADTVLGDFVAHLKAAGKWERSVLVVLADHSMDWSMPWAVISLHREINGYPPLVAGHPELAGKVVIAQNGGADLLYWAGTESERAAGVAKTREVVAGVAGVLSVHEPAELRLGPEAGDLVAYCKQGWRFSDEYPWSNPIPGNHGHPTTEPIPFLIAGGDPIVRSGEVVSAPARTIDVAPTVSALFGLGEPEGGYDGAVRSEAFTAVAPSGTGAGRPGRWPTERPRHGAARAAW